MGGPEIYARFNELTLAQHLLANPTLASPPLAYEPEDRVVRPSISRAAPRTDLMPCGVFEKSMPRDEQRHRAVLCVLLIMASRVLAPK